MRPKRRAPSSTSMDGFVRRRVAPDASGGSQNGPVKNRQEGMSRRTLPSQKLAFTDESWSDDQSTLTLGIDQLPENNTKKPHWWQFRKKNKLKSDHPDKPHRKLKRFILFVLLIGVIVAGFIGWKVLRTSSHVFNGNVLGFFNTTKLRGEEDGRVNILLAGTSEDDGPDHGGASLTDSIMIISIDTKNNTAFTTSIPRDLWVKYGEQCAAGYAGKINNAYECGESVKFDEPGYPKGGMGLLTKIISTNLGFPIQYYGKIDYSAFKDAVNAVGGIQITVDSNDPRGIYDPNIQPKDGGPVRLKNGVNTLDGIHALALARSRNAHGGYGLSRGDFDRTLYQRKMLIALKDKALSAGVLSNPAKIGNLLDAAGNNVQTNFKTSELRRLYDLSKLVKNQNIKSVDLADPEVNLIKTGMYSGQSIVMPAAGIGDFSDLQNFFNKIMSTDPLVTENASAVVLNGSGETGLAQKYAKKLSDKGVTVSVISNAPATQNGNSVYDLSKNKKPKTKSFLASDLSTTALSGISGRPELSKYTADFVVILGKTSASTARQ